MKSLLVISIILVSVTSMAQERKSATMLGGSASFQAVESYSVLQLSPRVGTFVTHNILIGLEADLVREGGDGSSATMASFGPLLRAYSNMKEDTNVAFFADAGVQFSYVNFWEVSETDYSHFSFGAGISYLIGKRVALEPVARYLVPQEGTGVFQLEIGFSAYLFR